MTMASITRQRAPADQTGKSAQRARCACRFGSNDIITGLRIYADISIFQIRTAEQMGSDEQTVRGIILVFVEYLPKIHSYVFNIVKLTLNSHRKIKHATRVQEWVYFLILNFPINYCFTYMISSRQYYKFFVQFAKSLLTIVRLKILLKETNREMHIINTKQLNSTTRR